MNTEPECNRTINIGYHVVLLLDVLNQREAIERLAKLPEGPEQKQEYLAAVKNSAGKVAAVRKSLVNYFESFLAAPSQIPLDKLSAEQTAAYQACQAMSIRTQMFSDTIIAYSPLLNSHGQLGIRGVYSLLGAAGSTMILCLATGVAIRGAIEIGVAMELGERDLYGPGFADAYRLEHDVAQYPRIVVGKGLLEYLKSFHEPGLSGLLSCLNVEFARTCEGMIAQDLDGVCFVDHLGRGFREVFGSNMTRELIEKSRRFADAEHEHFVKAGNHTLALRYAWLRKYIDTGLSQSS